MLRKRGLNEDIISDSEETVTEDEDEIKKKIRIEEDVEPLAKVCGLRMDVDQEFKNHFIDYDENLIVIYDGEDPTQIYCYTINELQDLFKERIYERFDQGNVTFIENDLFVKLPFYDINVEFFSLLYVLQNHFNTIRLSNYQMDNEIFYRAHSSSREEISLEGENNFNSLDFICRNVARQLYNYYVRTVAFDIPDGYTVSWNQFEPTTIQVANVTLKNFSSDWPREIEFNDDGTKRSKKWIVNNRFHRENDEPAVVFYENEIRTEERWCRNGELHRDNNRPAIIFYDENGYRREEEWYINGVMSRATAEATWIFYHNYYTKSEERWTDEELDNHRENGPAVIIYNIYESIIREEWYKHGILHREDGPAVIIYDDYERIIREEWYDNGILHREDGPAVIIYNSDRTVNTTIYYYNGVRN